MARGPTTTRTREEENRLYGRVAAGALAFIACAIFPPLFPAALAGGLAAWVLWLALGRDDEELIRWGWYLLAAGAVLAAGVGLAAADETWQAVERFRRDGIIHLHWDMVGRRAADWVPFTAALAVPLAGIVALVHGHLGRRRAGAKAQPPRAPREKIAEAPPSTARRGR